MVTTSSVPLSAQRLTHGSLVLSARHEGIGNILKDVLGSLGDGTSPFFTYLFVLLRRDNDVLQILVLALFLILVLFFFLFFLTVLLLWMGHRILLWLCCYSFRGREEGTIQF